MAAKHRIDKGFRVEITDTVAGAAPAALPAPVPDLDLQYFKKYLHMLQTLDLENLLYHTLHLALPCDHEGVVLGSICICDNPGLVRVVMEYAVRFYDLLLARLSLNTINRITLQMQRCFTQQEYNMLFDPSERDFSKPIFRTLLITNHTDRRLFITNRDKSDASFLNLLKNWSKVHNPVLYAFIYGDTFGTASQI